MSYCRLTRYAFFIINKQCRMLLLANITEHFQESNRCNVNFCFYTFFYKKKNIPSIKRCDCKLLLRGLSHSLLLQLKTDTVMLHLIVRLELALRAMMHDNKHGCEQLCTSECMKIALSRVLENTMLPHKIYTCSACCCRAVDGC